MGFIRWMLRPTWTVIVTNEEVLPKPRMERELMKSKVTSLFDTVQEERASNNRALLVHCK